MNLHFWKNGFALAALLLSLHVAAGEHNPPFPVIEMASLPGEARTTLTLIKRGGPFESRKDGAIFGNVEGVLPRHKRGYYHEYTVKTPGIHGRGARRIVAGGEPNFSSEFYYTDDHYATFRRIRE